MNVFSMLHGTIDNGVHILFSKTDYLHYDFEAIARFGYPCIVICGNSDYCIGHPYHPFGEKLADCVPDNVIAIFCQNCLVRKDHPNYNKFVVVPVGIENYIKCKRQDISEIHCKAVEKYTLLSTMNTDVSPITDCLYSNFMVRSNCQSLQHRELIRKISIQATHIKWQEPTLTSEQFYSEVLNHDATICAQGNGPGDNHRIYEVLYLNRIPITFNREMYDRIHKNFPVVFIEQSEMLNDRVYVLSLVEQAKNMKWNREMLYAPYWMDVISKTAKFKGIL
jgi:hypothetical protein